MQRRRSLSPVSNCPASGNDYEVFLSFRGPDARQSFTDCLYQRLKGAGIRVFRDDDELCIGERISGALLQALSNSKIYIPIFSKTYASSKWCLMELAKMLENTFKFEGKKEILPLFFDVEVDDVKLKTPLYRDTLLEHEKRYSIDEVNAWREALVQVAEIKGWTLKTQGHGELIELVIKEVLMKLNIKYKKLTEHFIEDHSQINAILKLLDIKSKGVRFVGLYGTGGIGKTTMAKVIFNKLHSQFDHCCFLENVRETSSRCKGIEYLQKQLLSTIIGSQFVHEIYDPDEGINMIEQRFCCKKVLIVLDDLDEEEQLGKLARKCDWFGSGSRIIVTTREKSILNSDVGKSSGHSVPHASGILSYEVREMNFDQALQLFCKHVFRRDSPLKGYYDLSREVVSTLGRLPLAIEVIGSFLSDSYMDKELWEETLEQIREAPPQEVQHALMISYDKLDYSQLQVFLDIACLFIDEDKTFPIFMWGDCRYHPHKAIKVLLCKSLIKFGEDNRFWMHDQVRDLGRHIMYKKICRCPGKPSRVWTNEDALNILKSKEGNEDVEALSLYFDTYGHVGCTITNDEVASLGNLRFLWTSGTNFTGDFRNLLPNLRWLTLQNCPPNFTAINFCPINLVVLDLSHSNISEDWGGWSQIKMTGKLKVLDLTSCKFLIRTPNFSNFLSLEILTLAWCSRLTTVDHSIGELKKLKALNMERCSSLRELPEEIGSLKSLLKIILPKYCPKLSKLPETIGNLKALLDLMIICSRVSRLPFSIGGLVNLTYLSLEHCKEIKELPGTIGELKSLVGLDLSWSGIVDLPDSIRSLRRLEVLRMASTPIRKLPKGIGMLEMLKVLDVNGCWDLGEIPEEIGSLSQLRELDLAFTRISKLPSTISRLSCLETLELTRCYKLEQLPEEIGSLSRLRKLTLSGTRISKLPSIISHLSCLETLNLCECDELQQLPEEIGNLSQLRELTLLGTRISKLPSTISHLSCLETLNLCWCDELQQLPEEIGTLSRLRELMLTNTHISKLPSTISRLSFLETLDLEWCWELQQLPELPSGLTHLRLPLYLDTRM